MTTGMKVSTDECCEMYPSAALPSCINVPQSRLGPVNDHTFSERDEGRWGHSGLGQRTFGLKIDSR